MQGARERALHYGLLDFDMRRQKGEMERQQRADQAEAAKQRAIRSFIDREKDPARRAQLEAAAAVGALDNVIGDQFKPQVPMTDIGKLNAALQAGEITRDQYNAAVRKETYIAPQQPRQPAASIQEMNDFATRWKMEHPGQAGPSIADFRLAASMAAEERAIRLAVRQGAGWRGLQV